MPLRRNDNLSKRNQNSVKLAERVMAQADKKYEERKFVAHKFTKLNKTNDFYSFPLKN